MLLVLEVCGVRRKRERCHKLRPIQCEEGGAILNIFVSIEVRVNETKLLEFKCDVGVFPAIGWDERMGRVKGEREILILRGIA